MAKKQSQGKALKHTRFSEAQRLGALLSADLNPKKVKLPKEEKPTGVAYRYYSQPGTLSGRLDEIETHFAAALTGIEQELERTPESEKGLLRFLRMLQQRACDGEFKIEDYRCYRLGKEEGTITETPDGKGGWIEI